MSGGFSIDGISAADYGVTLLKDPDIPLISSSRDRKTQILNRSGVIWIDSALEPRYFSLECMFRNCFGPADLDSKIRTLAGALVDSSGKPKQIKLIFDETPDLYYLVRYSGSVPFARAWAGCSKFVLNLVADDPYTYEVDEEYDYKTITTSGGNMTVTSSGTVSTPASICVENNGAAEIASGFTIKIEQEIK
jgi:predicted phage tail component-like protein